MYYIICNVTSLFIIIKCVICKKSFKYIGIIAYRTQRLSDSIQKFDNIVFLTNLEMMKKFIVKNILDIRKTIFLGKRIKLQETIILKIEKKKFILKLF